MIEKNIKDINEIFFIFDSLIDEGQIITIARTKNLLKAPSYLLQKFLQYYFENRKDKLLATYLVEGYKNDNREYICAAVPEENILGLKKEGCNLSIKIYSIQSKKCMSNSSVIWKQEINELDKLHKNNDLKNQLVIPGFSEIILHDLKQKYIPSNSNLQKIYEDKKIELVEDLKYNKYIDDISNDEAFSLKKEYLEDDKNNDASIKLCNNIELIYKSIEKNIEGDLKHFDSNKSNNSNSNKEDKKLEKFNLPCKRKSVETKISCKKNKKNIENFKINEENKLNNSTLENLIEHNYSNNEVGNSHNNIFKKEKKIIDSTINIKEQKINQVKIESSKAKDENNNLFQFDSSEDSENEIIQNTEEEKIFPQIKSVKETQMFYENGYLVTIDKDTCVRTENFEPEEKHSKSNKNDNVFSNKKRKNLQQTLLTSFFKKKK